MRGYEAKASEDASPDHPLIFEQIVFTKMHF